jgi:3'-5' exoribonuclease
MQVSKIKELADGAKFSGLYAISNASVRQAKTGKEFLTCDLVDRTGRMPAKIWSFQGKLPVAGSIWSVEGKYSPFNGEGQVVIDRQAEVDQSTIDPSMFMASLTDAEQDFYEEQLVRLIDLINDDTLRSFVAYTLNEMFPQFHSWVGAKSNHHARLGGLLQHSVNVTKLALAMAKSYKGTHIADLINTDILIAGGLLHDLGKIGEYTTASNTIELSTEGLLTRHYDTNVAYLTEAWIGHGRKISRDTLLMLFHIMVTHHGPDLSERPPSFISAWLLHAADLADSFIEAGVEALNDGTRADGFSIEKSWVIRNHFRDETFHETD